MAGSGKPDGASDQQSIGDLVALAVKDVSSLIRYEIALAKRELKIDGTRLGTAAGLVVGGLMIAIPGIMLLCFAYAYFLYWAGAPGAWPARSASRASRSWSSRRSPSSSPGTSSGR